MINVGPTTTLQVFNTVDHKTVSLPPLYLKLIASFLKKSNCTIYSYRDCSFLSQKTFYALKIRIYKREPSGMDPEPLKQDH